MITEFVFFQTKTITHLIETAIYVATVDKSHEVLKHALQWYRDNKPKVTRQNEREISELWSAIFLSPNRVPSNFFTQLGEFLSLDNDFLIRV